MALNSTLLELGPCQITFDGVDQGILLGDVEIPIEEEFAELHGSQFGKTILNHIKSGKTVMCKASLAETDLQRLATAIGGVVTAGGTGQGVVIRNDVGADLLAGAKVLELRKWINGVASADVADRVTFPKAAVLGKTKIVFSSEKQRSYDVEWHIYPDTATGIFGRVGDPTAA